MSLRVEIPEYQGPMDILLRLVEDKKMDILNISISEITESYVEILDEISAQLDPEEMSDFLLMAATLMQIKSRQLLYKPTEEEDDPTEELTRRLVEYKQYKEIVPKLWNLYEEASKCFGKRMEDLSPYLADEMPIVPDVGILKKLFYSLHLNQKQSVNVDLKIPEDVFPIEHYMNQIRCKWHGVTVAAERLFRGISRIEKIVTFLALLELVKDGWGKLKEQNGIIFLQGGDVDG